jgi:hypothetical protein
MLYLYLDESGDLGFDFQNKYPSKYFTITILTFRGTDINRKFGYAVRKTLARRLNQKNHRKHIVAELKGAHTTLSVKEYLYKQIQNLDFNIYAITLDKQKMLPYAENKMDLYNYAVKLVIDKIPPEKIDSPQIEFIIDKSKDRTEIAKFDEYIRQNVLARISLKVKLHIYHENSQKQKGLQIVDLFCWGIFQKYEHSNTAWLNKFREKIKYERKYFE